MEISGNRLGKRVSAIERLIEGCWLTLLALVPLAVVPEGLIAGAIQGPKVFVFRSIVLILVASLTISYTTGPGAAELRRQPIDDSARKALSTLRSNPVALAVAGVMGANIIAFILSPVHSVSWGGVDPGFDSYGLLTILSFLVMFVALVSYLRTEVQLRRLLGVVALTGVVIGAHGLAQHFGFDPFQDEPSSRVRLTFTFGNPIFGAAYLLMTIPLSLVLWETLRTRWSPALHSALGVGLIVLPLFGVAYSLSRGALISLAFALLVYISLGAFSFGLRFPRRTITVLAVSLVLVLLAGLLPTPGNTAGASQLGDRIGSINEAFTPDGGGLSGRYSIWSTAVDAYLTTPWVDEDQNPELPGLGLRPLRRVIGFGPDLFGVAYRMVSSDFKLGPLERNAHNFVVHTLVELGLLGVLAYAWMATTLFYVLWTIVRQARRTESEGIVPLVAVGLGAAFMGRLLEQMAGKAQLSDLMLMWVLIGVVAALANHGAMPRLTVGAGAPVPPGQRRGTPQRSGFRGGTSTYASTLVALLALAIWWQTSLADIRALSLSGRAQQAGTDGDAATAGALYKQAINVAPHASIPRLLLAQGLLNSARSEANAAESLASLEQARAVIQGVLDRNPLDLRARQWAGTISQEIALIDASFWAQAVRDAELVMALSPGLWEQLQPLAWALAFSGNFDRALDVVHRAQALGGAESPAAHLLYYVEAKIERERGNTLEANLALEKLKTFTHPDVQFLVDDAQ